MAGGAGTAEPAARRVPMFLGSGRRNAIVFIQIFQRSRHRARNRTPACDKG